MLVPAHGRHLGARCLAHLPVSQLEVVRGPRRTRGMPLAGSLHSPCFSLCSSLLLPGCMACGRTSGLLRALCIQYLYVLLLSLSCCLWLHGSLANKELGVPRAQLHGHVAMPCPPLTAHFRAENCMASSPAPQLLLFAYKRRSLCRASSNSWCFEGTTQIRDRSENPNHRLAHHSSVE